MIDKIKTSIEDFLNGWASGNDEFSDVCIYNEFSFQFELGKYLRIRFPDYKVQFERNISDFFINEANYGNNAQLKKDRTAAKKPFYKREIDIVIFKDENPWDAGEKYAVELKYIMPSDNIDRAYELLEDIAFTQQLINPDNFTPAIENVKNEPFNGTIAVTLCNRETFWKPSTRKVKKVKPEISDETVRRYAVFRTDNGLGAAKCELTEEQTYRREYGKKSDKPSYKDVVVKPCEITWVKLNEPKDDFRYYMVVSK